ncbi:MAG: helix-turn-helix transcriptional regulator [Ktedonobacteraceae bacterium]|nr:helix-turn-helix transcriptional regulator [Ktedonobacteraceae bacterium]
MKRTETIKRAKLTAARAEKCLTLENAAELIGCAANTLSRWELGRMTPSAYNRARLCAFYGKTPEELGLVEEQSAPVSPLSALPDTVQAFLNADLTTHLLALVCTHQADGRLLQNVLARTIEEFPMTTGHDAVLTRREALRRLAMLPVLFSSRDSTRKAVHDTLVQYAAGITACEYLGRGDHEDIALAFSLLTAYVPVLRTIVKDSSMYRKEAAGLAAQCYLLIDVLGFHMESPTVAIAKGYAQLAVTYSQESGDTVLCLRALRNLTWAYNHIKQFEPALQTIERARLLMEQSRTPLPPQLRSSIYSTLAVIQVKNGVSATPVLGLAQEAFFGPPGDSENLVHVSFSYAQLMRNIGITQYYQAEYKEALQSFAQVIDPNDLSAKVVMRSTTHVGLLNTQTKATLKSPNRDLEQVIALWKAALQGAITLQSQQCFDEASMTYEVMEGVWPGEPRIRELRDLVVHW